MKRALSVVFLVLLPIQAQAIERYTSTSMSCSEVQAAIKSDGAAIMRYQSTRVAGLPLYGRYVRSSQFCDGGQTTERTAIPAADTRSCRVLKCVPIEFETPSR